MFHNPASYSFLYLSYSSDETTDRTNVKICSAKFSKHILNVSSDSKQCRVVVIKLYFTGGQDEDLSWPVTFPWTQNGLSMHLHLILIQTQAEGYGFVLHVSLRNSLLLPKFSSVAKPRFDFQ